MLVGQPTAIWPIHYFGNESSESLLEAYGIMSKDKNPINTLNPKICSNCSEGNTQDAKFCSRCKMIISLEGYQEALESQKEKEDKLTSVEKRFNDMQLQMQSVLAALASMEQSTKNTFAKRLFENGLYNKG